MLYDTVLLIYMKPLPDLDDLLIRNLIVDVNYITFICRHLLVFHATKRAFESWHRLSEIVFFLASGWTTNLSNVSHLQQSDSFLLNLNLYPFSLRFWRLCLNGTFITTNKCCMSLLRHGWQCEGLVRCEWIVHCHGNAHRLFHNPSKQARRKGRKETGDKNI